MTLYVGTLPGSIRAERYDRAAVQPLFAMPHAEVERDHSAKRVFHIGLGCG